MPERLQDSDRFLVRSTVGIVKFGLGCEVSCWSSEFEPSNRGCAAKAARVIFPLPATFMPFQIDFCSQDCQSSLVALYISHSASSPSLRASVSRSQSRFAPGTSPQTRLKSLAQLLCSAGHQTSHSTISLCHSVNHFLGPNDGHSVYFEPSRVRCRAQIRSVIWASVGLVEVCRLVIQTRTDLSARSIALFSLAMVVRILFGSQAISVRYR